MHKLKSLFTVSLLLVSVPLFANPIENAMETMDKQLSVLTGAKDNNVFQHSATTFLAASKTAQNTRPKGLNDKEFADYQVGLQQVIDVVSDAEQLAKAGKLDEAKAALAKLDAIKKTYHKKYK